ncbi:hypothetical protein LX97_00706 [Nonlabens dokdonensis]|uniref:DUF4190 domain-containing protein n=2 Tax=Nonlabens dokdonensis TaxID=328515 RepID=L7W756_NONDD|nr:CCC motif membrane protein [Nonlabens dokdonensis]AGC76032.1 hypothetical protein DDD_0905 [Nonlabens dokdonensis DSW-6]PZX43704.1 hypothetical protein LX97_00706 [Nonlabens dokdonensis]
MENDTPNYSNKPPYGNSGQQPYQNQGQQRSGQNQYQNQGNYQFPYQGEKLPGDPSALTLGIVSLVLFFMGCICYGIPSIITLILGIIGLVIANRSLATYQEDPSKYSQSTVKSVNAGKVINIISVALSGLTCLIFLIIALFFGGIFLSIMNGEFEGFEDFKNQQEQESIYEDDNSYSDDDWQYNDDTEAESIELENDSVPVFEEMEEEEL